MLKTVRAQLGLMAVGVTLFVAGPVFAKEGRETKEMRAARQAALACERALIPDVYALNIVRGMEPQKVQYNQPFTSPGVTDYWLKLGRRAVAYPDFKFLSDLERRDLTETEKREIIERAKKFRREVFDTMIAKGVAEKKAVKMAQAAYARQVIVHLYKVEEGLKISRVPVAKEKWELLPNRGQPLNTGEVVNNVTEKALKQTEKFEKLRHAFHHVENMWQELARTSPERSKSSLLSTPYDVLIAGGRFRESYYWDSYFGALGLLATDRRDLAASQLENFLHMIQVFGRIPNGMRDYYLSRSQPPVVSMMAMAIYEHARRDRRMDQSLLHRWLTERVYPLLKQDYKNFWLAQRTNAETGLSFYSDDGYGSEDGNELRPERHSNDVEHELGETPKDVKAQAESGLDHTDTLLHHSSQVASVKLNAFLYQYELNLAQMAMLAGKPEETQQFNRAARHRQKAMNKYMWDELNGVFRNYDLRNNQQVTIVHSDIFSTLYTGAASRRQAQRIVEFAEKHLEYKGGLGSSTVHTGKQWDGYFGWAPTNMMAVQGAENYGHREFARRIGTKWVNTLADIHARTGNFYEKIDVARADVPKEDGKKYPTQTGFLWTNASYVWTLKFLGFEFERLPDNQ